MAAIMPFFQWCDNTWLAQAIRNSRVAFPIIENFHLFALTVLLGSLVIVVLRQFGLVYKAQPISEVAGALRPWNRWSLAVMLTSGILLFFSEAMKCYGNTSFRVKMIFLFFALLFQFTVYNRMVKNEGKYARASGKVAAAIAVCLWFGVGLAGRSIGFLG
ncbi:MAG: hypothetical protein JOZ32_05135 [Bryobacterales bacterium]|nr:hypothetical protein [Bryobacterales bacterium]